MRIGDICTFKGTVKRVFCDKPNFRACSVSVDEVEQGVLIKHPTYNTVSVHGEFQEVKQGSQYSFEIEYEGENQYGHQYRATRVSIERPTTPQQIEAFLSEIISVKRAKEVVRVYPNIIDMVLKDEKIDTSKMKGIGDKVIENIKNKIIDNIGCFELHKVYGHLGLTFPTLSKILKRYKTVDNAIYNFDKNPYEALTQIHGIGFIKADEIASKLNPSFINSLERMTACITYYLSENENNGNTYMGLDMLHSECLTHVQESIAYFKVALNSEDIYYEESTNRVARMSTRKKEEYIVEKLLYMDKVAEKWDVDIEQFRKIGDEVSLTDQQISVLKSVSEHGVTCLTGYAGCVDKDTEFFTGFGWKKICDYQDGDLVLQFNKDYTANLVKPLQYIKNKQDKLNHFETKYGLDQCLSDNHNIVYLSSKGNINIKPMKEMKEMHERSKNGFSGRFIASFKYEGCGINLTDEEIRLMIAVIADGSFSSETSTNRCRVNLKKDRKKERIRLLLQQANVEYVEVERDNGYTVFSFDSPKREKTFLPYWYNANKHQLEIIADEVVNWDGNRDRGEYYTCDKPSADFIQFVFSSLDIRTSLFEYDRVGKDYCTNGKIYTRVSKEYRVSIAKKIGRNPSIGGFRNPQDKTKIKEHKTLDGYEYCFTVPSGMLVLRRNNKIFVTGNCGKSQSVSSCVSMLKRLGKTYRLCTPTAKSADVLADFTHEDVKTIHRTLGYNGSGFEYNEECRLGVDVVIVDEVSMVDLNLFYALLKAIDEKTTRILLVGDPSQLPSIGAGNILNDLTTSGVITVNELNKVFRYGDGGLMRIATDIRNGVKFLDSGFTGSKAFGANKDFCYTEIDQDYMVDNALTYYKKLLDNGNTTENVAIITNKNVSKFGTIEINRKVQAMLQEGKTNEKIVVNDGLTLYLGDKVKQKVNNYDIEIVGSTYNNDLFGEENEEENNNVKGEVYNGQTGVVTHIDNYNKLIHVRIKGVEYVYKKDMISEQLVLGYCVTTTSSQGMSIDYVITLLPRADTFMASSNALYTAVTRSRIRCYLLGNINTVNNAIKKKINLTRNTFTKELLVKGGELNA